MAGESARDVARRQREKAARLNASADRWEKGAAGEQATARALTMLPTTWRVLHDVRWPGRRYANIDHIVVGPPGVFVIDSKAWSGDVVVRDGVLRQNGHSREREVAGAADAALAVAEAVPGLSPERVHPVLCLVRDDAVANQAREVTICSTSNLVSTLLARPGVLDARQVGSLQGQVSWAMSQALRAPRPQTSTAARVSGGTAGARPARTRQSQMGWGTPLKLVLLAVGLLFVLSVVGSLFAVIGDGVSRLTTPRTGAGQGSQPADRVAGELALGQSGTLPRATNRPPLRVTAEKFVTTKTVGESSYLMPGNRIVAVRFTITNQGKRTWVSQPGTQIVLKGESNIPYQASLGVTTLAGPGLPEVIRLRPGKTVRGHAVFQVSQSRVMTEVDLTVGPGQPAGLVWLIDRQ